MTARQPLLEPSARATDVPFFPQAKYQCGPAALAATLTASGVAVSPEVLVDRVYVPERKGSLQIEMLATIREFDRLAYVLRPDSQAIVAELRAGRPVLVLQNLLTQSIPRWHYAVVIAFDSERQEFELHSGTTANKRVPVRSFLRTWGNASGWAVVALRPGELPADPEVGAYLRALIDVSGQWSVSELTAALDAASTYWPDNTNVAFVSANLYRVAEQREAAAAEYLRALRLDPGHAGARNNFADLLITSGCYQSAAAVLEPALGAPADAVIHATLLQTEAELKSAVARSGLRDTVSACRALAN